MRTAVCGCLSVLIACFCLAAAAGPVRAERTDPPADLDHLGLYANPDATGCDLDLAAGESVTLELLAVLPTLGSGGLTALEFRVAGLPVNGVGGIYTTEWNTELVIGQIDTGIALAFSDPIYNEIIPIGRVTFQAFTDDWLGEDCALHLAESTTGPKLVIVDDDYIEIFLPGSTFTFNCSDPDACACGLLQYPGCLVVPPAYDFGFVPVGEAVNRRFNIVNYTPATLSGAVTEACAHFSLVSGEGDFTLLPGQVRVVTVRYAPTGLGQHACSVELGSEFCAEFICTGNNLPPPTTCELSTDHLDFGEVEVGRSAERSFTITNTGESLLLATIEEYCPAFYLSSGGGTAWLNPGESRTVTVRFSPTGLGPQACQIETAPNGENNCGPVTCIGTGIPNPIDCALTPELLDFGDVGAGEQVDRPFTIENLYDEPISVHVAISGEGFSIVQGGGQSVLAPGQILQGIVRFHYICQGEFTGTLTTGHPECPSIPCVANCLPRNPRSWANICIFSESNGYYCYKDIEPFTWTTVYIVATVSADVAGVSGAEFRIADLPPADCVTLGGYWAADHATGNLRDGVTLTFDVPRPGPRVLLCTLEVYQTDPDCIGDHYEMLISESLSSGDLAVFDDCGDGINATGGHFTFNCNWGCDCFWVTPVSLSQFTVEDLGAAARARWETATAGEEEFRLEAALDGSQWSVPYEKRMPGHYEATDESPLLSDGGQVTYSLHGRAAGEDWSLLRSESITVSARRWTTRLLAPHPNPFNPAVTIPFTLAETGRVTLAVYDIGGRRVAMLADGVHERGDHELTWLGRDAAGRQVSSGVYFVSLQAPGFSARQQLVLLR